VLGPLYLCPCDVDEKFGTDGRWAYAAWPVETSKAVIMGVYQKISNTCQERIRICVTLDIRITQIVGRI